MVPEGRQIRKVHDCEIFHNVVWYALRCAIATNLQCTYTTTDEEPPLRWQ